MIHTTDTDVRTVSAVRIIIYCSHGWKHPRHAKCLEWSCMTLMWLILATTKVQFITSGIGLRVASACLWQKLYHFTSHKVADAFGNENAFSA